MSLIYSTFCGPQLRAPDAGVCFRLLLLAPVLEEWVLRAGLQEWLTGLGPWRAGAAAAMAPAAPVLLSCAAFGLLHLGSGPLAALAVMAPGLLLALLYQHRRDWRLCALTHAAFNAMALGFCMP